MSVLVRLKIFGLAITVAAAAGLFAPAAWADDTQLQSGSVEVYTNQAVPIALPPGVQANSPLKAGQMTLQDVLEAHPPQKPPSQVSATAPLLAPTSTASSERVMLMQGMQSALQEPGTGKPTRLKPPQMQTGLAPALQPASATGMAIVSASGNATPGAISATNVQYQPGREPKNLDGSVPASALEQTTQASAEASAGSPMPSEKPAEPAAGVALTGPASTEMPVLSSSESPPAPAVSGVAEAPKATDLEQAPASLDSYAGAPSAPSVMSDASAPSGNVAQAMREAAIEEPPPTVASIAPEPSSPPAAAPAASVQASATSGSGCQPHVESWTKSCNEAGYPSSYVGKISGETRTLCPQGDLQDVWMENSCTPPPDNAAAAPSTTAMAQAALAQAEQPAAKPAESAPPVATQMASAEQLTQAPAEPMPEEKPVEKPIETAQVAVPATEEAPPIITEPSSPSASVDANCGNASGLATSAKPAADLCLAGTPSEVTGDGPWRWDCSGANGGMTVSCAAPVAKTAKETHAKSPAAATTAPAASTAPEDAACGMANGAGLDQAPVADLCMKGVASRVNGGGPWTWACSGVNGGKASACAAQKKSDGACGSSNGAGATEMPAAGLCTTGIASAVTGDGPWNWTCAGLYGGAAATCSAEAKKAAVCGSATSNGHKEAPAENLCNTGNPSSVSGSGPWSWTCDGLDGGASVVCEAKASVSGACGAANGIAVAKTPADDLCTSGKPTRVTGKGPWNWSCAGSEGGDMQSCTAPKLEEETSAPANATPPAAAETGANEGLCGTAANVASVEAPAENLCAAGSAGKIKSEKNSWVWNCDGAAGGASVSCSSPRMKADEAPAPMAAPAGTVNAGTNVASCGAASGRGSLSVPKEDLCAVGKATIVRGRGPWNWKCIKGKEKASCNAPKQVDAACGPTNGSMQKGPPTHELCSAGAATQVAGQGPWIWTCVGTGGGASVSCSAASQAQTRIDGACGASSSNTMTAAPSANLCDSGTPSSVYGEGPWTWTCSGVNGGVAASCETQKVVPNAPPPPGPAVNGLCGAANGVAGVAQPSEGLCSSGTLTAISGDGPWNWSCLGQNGGMTVSCTAPLMPPASVTGSCGAASGQPTLTMPKSGLCSAGISSAVNGEGPWTWSCSGTNGGGAVGCVAPLATSGGGPLPGVTAASTSSSEAPAPHAAPTAAVSSSLVTPRLPAGPLPPLETGTMPPSKPFPPAPTGAEAPESAVDVTGALSAPSAAPGLPADTNPLEPPPVRDTIKPSPALKPPAINSEGKVIPGNRFVLDDDVSTVAFTHGSENIGNDILPTLDKLAGVLKAHSDVRVTLTAYAGLDATTAPRDARRLSLGRALAIRDYLTAKGIASGRIDVRALGANVVTGEADRVDIRAN